MEHVFDQLVTLIKNRKREDLIFFIKWKKTDHKKLFEIIYKQYFASHVDITHFINKNRKKWTKYKTMIVSTIIKNSEMIDKNMNTLKVLSVIFPGANNNLFSNQKCNNISITRIVVAKTSLDMINAANNNIQFIVHNKSPFELFYILKKHHLKKYDYLTIITKNYSFTNQWINKCVHFSELNPDIHIIGTSKLIFVNQKQYYKNPTDLFINGSVLKIKNMFNLPQKTIKNIFANSGFINTRKLGTLNIAKINKQFMLSISDKIDTIYPGNIKNINKIPKEMENIFVTDISNVTNNINNKIRDMSSISSAPNISYMSDILKTSNIKIVHVSNSLIHFKERIVTKYNLIDYDYLNHYGRPLLMFGMYTDEDVKISTDHVGPVYLIWGGTDCDINFNRKNKLTKIGILRKLNICHVAISDSIFNRLLELKMKNIVRSNFSLLLENIFFPILPEDRGDSIYIYNGFNSKNKNDVTKYVYGYETYSKIMNELPFYKYILSDKMNCKYEEMPKIYSQSFIGLRLTKNDGNANTVEEMIQMDIPVMHNGDYKKSIKWESETDIISNILERDPRNTKNNDYILIFADLNFNVIDGSTIWLFNTIELLENDNNIILVSPINMNNETYEKLKNRKIMIVEPRNIHRDAFNNILETINNIDKNLKIKKILLRCPKHYEEIVKDYENISRKGYFYSTKYFPAFRKNNKIICQTKLIRNLYIDQEHPKCNTYLMYPPIKISNISNISNLCDKIGIALDVSEMKEIKLFYSGTIRSEENIEKIFKIYDKLSQLDKNTYLTIFYGKIHGSSIYVKKMKELFDKYEKLENVTIKKNVSRDAIINAIQESTIGFCIRDMSSSECLEISTKVLEYVGNGLPCITNNSRINKMFLGKDYPYFISEKNNLGLICDIISQIREKKNITDFYSSSKNLKRILGKNQEKITKLLNCKSEKIISKKLIDHCYLLYIDEKETHRNKNNLELLEEFCDLDPFRGVNGQQDNIKNKYYEYIGGDNFVNLEKYPEITDYLQKYESTAKSGIKKRIHSIGAWGHLHSFIKIIEDAKKNKYGRIAIFEPDIIFHNRFSKLLKKHEKNIEQSDIYYLGASQHSWLNINVDSYDNNYRTQTKAFTTGTFAIILNNGAFNDYLEILKLKIMPSDISLCFLHDKYVTNVCHPNIIISDVSDSKITKKRNMEEMSKKFRWNLGEYNYSKKIHPMNKIFDKVFVINLPHHKIKWKKMKDMLDNLGIEFEFFEASDGNSDKYLKMFKNLDKSSTIPSPGALGYIYSWKRIIDLSTQNNYSKILIFDDDVLFHSDFNNKISELLEKIKNIDWKILNLGSSQHIWKQVEIKENKNYYCTPYFTDGSFATGVDSEIFSDILSEIDKLSAPLDSGPLRHIYKNYKGKCITTWPNLVIADVSNSDINNKRNLGSHSKIMRWKLSNYDYSKYLKIKVSVIVPLYNKKNTIIQCIESLLNQTYYDLEIIVVDDCSTDDSYEIVKKFVKKYSNNFDNSKTKTTKLLKTKINSGCYVARNVGIKNSTGEFVAFLDADDVYLSYKIEKQMEIMIKYDCDICCCNIARSNESKLIIDDGYILNKIKDIKLGLGIATTLIKKEIFDEYGLYREDMRHSSDLEYIEKVFCLKYGIDPFTIEHMHNLLSNPDRKIIPVNFYYLISEVMYVSHSMDNTNITNQYTIQEKKGYMKKWKKEIRDIQLLN